MDRTQHCRIILVGSATAFPAGTREELRSAGYVVEQLDRDTVGLPSVAWTAWDLLIIEHSPGFDPYRICDSATDENPAIKIIFITADSPIDVIEERLNRHYPDNILTSTSLLETRELVQTVQKIFSDDIFGFRFYVPAGADIRTIAVDDSKKKDHYIRQVRDYAVACSIRPRIVECVAEVLDEMIMNVLYDAPTDAAGKHINADMPRTQRIVLSPGKTASLSWTTDNGFLIISMADPFGSLTKDRVVYYLHKCYGKGPSQIDTKKGGAGLGLYKIFENVNQFVINISPGRKTEFIVFIATGSRGYRPSSRSFNLFVKE